MIRTASSSFHRCRRHHHYCPRRARAPRPSGAMTSSFGGLLRRRPVASFGTSTSDLIFFRGGGPGRFGRVRSSIIDGIHAAGGTSLRDGRFLSSYSSLGVGDDGAADAATTVKIGHVSRSIRPQTIDSRPDLIPRGYLPPDNPSMSLLENLQWLMSKDNLSQDSLLVGPPGPHRRRVALAYAELMRREVEMLTLSPDTTESDLKQRRELRADGNVEFVDQAPVRAALYGRLLILDGLEGAERNVLPALNNLLENREMHLEDGRLIVSHRRYEELTGTTGPSPEVEAAAMERLVPAHPDFRVIALGVPVPPYMGNPLDPPLRSRFQIRRIDNPSPEELMDMLILDRSSSSFTSYGEPSKDPSSSSPFPSSSSPSSSLEKQQQQQHRHELNATRISTFAGIMDAASSSSSSSSFSSSQRSLTFPSSALPSTLRVMDAFPHETMTSVLARSYPFGVTAGSGGRGGDSSDGLGFAGLFGEAQTRSRKAFEFACDSIDGKEANDVTNGKRVLNPYRILDISGVDDGRQHREAVVTFSSISDTRGGEGIAPASASTRVVVPCGEGPFRSSPSHFVHTDVNLSVLSVMMQEHYAGRDLLLLSPRGEGKSALANEFANLLGYEADTFGLYGDMTSRDLLLRRATDPKTGETTWEESPLVRAAVSGGVCILDGVEKISVDALVTLRSLMCDRDLVLPDGRTLKALRDGVGTTAIANGCHENDASLHIHPSFRVVAIGSTSKGRGGISWLTEEVMSMFSSIVLSPPTDECLTDIIEFSYPSCPAGDVEMMLKFRNVLTEQRASDCGVATLSTRNLLRIAKKCAATAASSVALPVLPTNSSSSSVGGESNGHYLHSHICSVLMADLLPVPRRDALERLLEEAGINDYNGPSVVVADATGDASAAPTSSAVADDVPKFTMTADKLTVGGLELRREKSSRPEMVPSPDFFDIPNHVSIIENLLTEWSNGERAFLLLGNQGVGKNKIVDRLLQLANVEREYVQLHRDSTVGQLTISPTLEDGRVIWKDSPLVRAVQRGCALVIDEADKAPLEVVSLLKGLVEDGEMMLADGRRISRVPSTMSERDMAGSIRIHPDFTVWVLANRPGFPFLGNDFFREIGDCFSTHAIPNPDRTSELALLKSYAPNISPAILERLCEAFADLRELSDRGDVAYPYSTREAVAVVRHLSMYPREGVASTLRNVLDIDSFDRGLYDRIAGVFSRRGIPLGGVGGRNSQHVGVSINLAKTTRLQSPRLSEKWRLGSLGINHTPSGSADEVEVHRLRTHRLDVDVGRWRISATTPPTPFVPDECRVDEFSELVRKWDAVGRDGARAAGLATMSQGGDDSDSTGSGSRSVHVLTRGPILLNNFFDVAPGSDGTPSRSSIDIDSNLPYFVDTRRGIPPRMVALERNLLIFFTEPELFLSVDPISGVVTYLMLPPRDDTRSSLGGIFGRSWGGGGGADGRDTREWTMIPTSHTVGGGAIAYRDHEILHLTSDEHGRMSSVHRASLPLHLPPIEHVCIVGNGELVLRLSENGKDHQLWLGRYNEQDGSDGTRELVLQKVMIVSNGGNRDGAHTTSSRSAFYDNGTFVTSNAMLTDHTILNLVNGFGGQELSVHTIHRDSENRSGRMLGHNTAVYQSFGRNEANAENMEQQQSLVSVRESLKQDSNVAIETIDPSENLLRQVFLTDSCPVGVAPVSDDHLVYLESSGELKMFQINGIDKDLKAWKEIMGLPGDTVPSGEGNRMSIEYFRDGRPEGKSLQPPSLSSPKHGKWDDNNEAHVGGNQWSGGTGGSDTAGLGGRGGPYRLDRGHRVHQVSDEAKAQVTEEAAKAARKMAKEALDDKLAEIGMSKGEHELYANLVDPIRGDIANFRATLGSVEAKRAERSWIKRQPHGELDDSRLVDGVAGERYVYKRRGDVEPKAGSAMKYPKRMRFVMDCSGSMYRFNSQDERLNRCLEAAALIMESFVGMEDRFVYSIVGHSGDSNCIELVDFEKPPANDKERMKVLQKMVAHAQFCQSGDHTVSALKRAMVDVRPINRDGESSGGADECIVVCVSDANLQRYGIQPRDLMEAMSFPSSAYRRNEAGSSALEPKAYCIFIATLGRQAEELRQELPAGRSFVCMQTSDLPRAVRSILSSQVE